jgi:hypothetical protein
MRKEQIGLDRLTIRLFMKSTVIATQFIDEFKSHTIHHDTVRVILSVLCQSSITNGWFLSRSAPFREIHKVVDVIIDALKNPVAEVISISIENDGIGSATNKDATTRDGKKKLDEPIKPKITDTFKMVVKSDAKISYKVTAIKGRQINQQGAVAFSIKGNSNTVESTGASSLISMVYKVTTDRDLKDYCVNVFPMSFGLTNKVARIAFLEEFFEFVRRGREYEASPKLMLSLMDAVIKGSETNTFFKVDTKAKSVGVRTIDKDSLNFLKNNMRRAFIDTGTSAINFNLEDESGERKNLFTITINSAKTGVNISIPKWFLTK